jgi:hypothetical protein
MNEPTIEDMQIHIDQLDEHIAIQDRQIAWLKEQLVFALEELFTGQCSIKVECDKPEHEDMCEECLGEWIEKKLEELQR